MTETNLAIRSTNHFGKKSNFFYALVRTSFLVKTCTLLFCSWEVEMQGKYVHTMSPGICIIRVRIKAMETQSERDIT